MDEQSTPTPPPSTPEQQAQPSTLAPSTAHQDVEQKRVLVGILSYISILVVAAYVISKDTPALHFHVKQGVVLFALEIAAWVILTMIPILFPLMFIAQIIFLVFSIIGILNVVHKKERELPFIGHLATHVPM